MTLWQRIRMVLVWLVGVVVTVYLLVWIFRAAQFATTLPEWWGLPGDPLPPNTAVTSVVIYDQPRDLWDWAQLLLVPVVLAIGGFWLTRTENRYALELQEHREQEARKLEEERARDAALQAYLSAMTALLLEKNLRGSEQDAEVRSVARAQTLTVLDALDGVRKAAVLKFLYEVGLIGGYSRDEVPFAGVVNLSRANLQGAQLEGVMLIGANLLGINLNRANLQGGYLQNANLEMSNLRNANLEWTNMSNASLENANLENANLRNAVLFDANLSSANLLDVDLTECKVNPEQLTRAFRHRDAKSGTLRSRA